MRIGFSERDTRSMQEFRSQASSNKANCVLPRPKKLYDDVILELQEPDSNILNSQQKRNVSGNKLDMEDYMRMKLDSDSSMEVTPREI